MTDAILGYFDEVPVFKAAIEVRNLAGGFRDALEIDPIVMRSGDRVVFLCEAVVGDIDHDRINKEDLSKGWTRVHVLAADVVTFVDRKLVAETLEKHRARLALAKDDETGQQRIGSDADLELEHFAGRHAKRRKSGCPSCQREKDLEAEEKAEARATRAKATAEKKAGGKVRDIRSAKQ